MINFGKLSKTKSSGPPAKLVELFDQLDRKASHGSLRPVQIDSRAPPCPLCSDTIQVVIACEAYASIDGQSYADFLKMQCYDPADGANAKYAFTFDLCGKAFGRVLLETKGAIPDLADLYNHPWQDYKVCGYHSIYISRIDNRKLGRRELARLEKEVTYDLRYDYGQDDVDLWFDDQLIGGVLKVFVQDHVV